MTATLRCPVCKEPMTAVPVSDHCVAGCEACGGFWLDNAASNIVARASIQPALWAVVRGFDGIEAKAKTRTRAGYREAASRGRTCPICEEVLRERRAMGTVDVDVCSEHGTFFDQNEIQAIHNGVAIEQAKLAQREAMKKRALNSRHYLANMDPWFFDSVISFLEADD